VTYLIVISCYGDCLVGPHVLPHLLTGNRYRDFPLHDQHDGVQAHFSRAVRDTLDYAYHDRWIGRGGPTAWPPRSPDSNPLYLYLWGHLNVFVCAAPVHNEEALRRISDACQTVSNRIFERMRRSIIRGVEACTESHGGHFEHLLNALFQLYFTN
jgi:hypothetical protein